MIKPLLVFCLAVSALSATAATPTPADSAADNELLRLKIKYDGRVKGEFTCKEGKMKGAKVEYKKCIADKLDKYDTSVIIAKIKFDALDPKKKILAKKLAFLGFAHAELKKKLAAMGEAKKEDLEYKKIAGAMEKIKSDYGASKRKHEAAAASHAASTEPQTPFEECQAIGGADWNCPELMD